MVVQWFNFAPDGGVMLWISAQWWRNASILRLMAARCFGLEPDGGTMLQFCA
jgi:hypothetical protein